MIYYKKHRNLYGIPYSQRNCEKMEYLRKYNIVPFIIDDSLKMFYYRGLKEWDKKGYLRDTCLTGQDRYKAYLDYFRINY